MANKASYTGNPMPLAITRIASDRNMVMNDKEGYASSDIYFDFDKKKINTGFKILMIGSQDLSNPYMGGFFMFSGNYPDQYPFFPPHMQAMTQGKNTRFHPNFYVSGKCCVSILGTWSGPPWTSCQNMGTVAQTLKSLYIENPITQEPGWEDCTDCRSKIYKRIVEYRTLEIAVLQMLHSPPKGYEVFLPIMEQEFLKFWTKYSKKLDDLSNYDGKKYVSPIYNMEVIFDIKGLKANFNNTYKILQNKYKINLNNEEKKCEETVNTIPSDKSTEKLDNLLVENNKNKKNTNTTSSKKSTRKCPNDMAKKFEIGTKKLSENDNSIWIVKEKKNNTKYWVKII